VSNVYHDWDVLVWKPDPGVEYYEARKNIGRKTTLLGGNYLASAMIMKARNNLKVGRTVYQKMELWGDPFNLEKLTDLDIRYCIAIPSWLILDMTKANLRVKDGQNVEAILTYEDRENGNTRIKILGGDVDGNEPKQTGGKRYGLSFEKVTHFELFGPTIHHVGNHGFHFVACEDGFIGRGSEAYRCQRQTTGYDAFFVRGACKRLTFDDVYGHDNWTGVGSGKGGGLEVKSYRDSGVPEDITVKNSLFHTNGESNILTMYDPGYTTESVKRFVALNNDCLEAGWDGIDVAYTLDAEVELNRCRGNKRAGVQLFGIKGVPSRNNRLRLNRCWMNAYGIRENGNDVDYNRLIYNWCKDNTVKDVATLGAHTVVLEEP